MANNGDTPKNGSRWWVPILVAVISAFGGAFGGNFVWRSVVPPEAQRADPYTGSQGKLLEQRVAVCERHIENHPDRLNNFDRRIVENKAAVASCQRQLDFLRRDIERLEDRK